LSVREPENENLSIEERIQKETARCFVDFRDSALIDLFYCPRDGAVAHAGCVMDSGQSRPLHERHAGSRCGEVMQPVDEIYFARFNQGKSARRKSTELTGISFIDHDSGDDFSLDDFDPEEILIEWGEFPQNPYATRIEISSEPRDVLTDSDFLPPVDEYAARERVYSLLSRRELNAIGQGLPINYDPDLRIREEQQRRTLERRSSAERRLRQIMAESVSSIGDVLTTEEHVRLRRRLVDMQISLVSNLGRELTEEEFSHLRNYVRAQELVGAETRMSRDFDNNSLQRNGVRRLTRSFFNWMTSNAKNIAGVAATVAFLGYTSIAGGIAHFMPSPDYLGYIEGKKIEYKETVPMFFNNCDDWRHLFKRHYGNKLVLNDGETEVTFFDSCDETSLGQPARIEGFVEEKEGETKKVWESANITAEAKKLLDEKNELYDQLRSQLKRDLDANGAVKAPAYRPVFRGVVDKKIVLYDEAWSFESDGSGEHGKYVDKGVIWDYEGWRVKAFPDSHFSYFCPDHSMHSQAGNHMRIVEEGREIDCYDLCGNHDLPVPSWKYGYGLIDDVLDFVIIQENGERTYLCAPEDMGNSTFQAANRLYLKLRKNIHDVFVENP